MRARAHLVPFVLTGVFAASAIALVAYLLWPTWSTSGADAPDRLPVSVGGTLFNLPIPAIRMKIQRHPDRRSASISISSTPRWKRPAPRGT